MARVVAAIRRSWRGERQLFEVLLALTLAVLSVLNGVTVSPQYRAMDPLGISLLLAQTLPLALRQRRPPAVLGVTGVALTIYNIMGYEPSIGGLAVMVALYTVAVKTNRRTAAVLAAITAVGILLSVASYQNPNGLSFDTLVTNYIVFGTVWLLGDNVRVRRAYAAEFEARAAALAREREERARLAVADERARIARELHDVVAHNVSVMVVQAGAARRTLTARPGDAREALASIEATGRSALDEMRRMLGVLRSDSRDERLEPQPGIDRLDGLLEQVRDAGLPVDLAVEGPPRSLPSGIDLTAYRIVQEALTNVLKHGGTARAHVALRYGRYELAIEVADDGRGAAAAPPAPTAGHGLIGMRERVALYGGTLQAGPRISGGYVVHATLPLDGAA